MGRSQHSMLSNFIALRLRKMAPRAPQEAPRSPREAPRGPREAPRGPQDSPKTAPKTHFKKYTRYLMLTYSQDSPKVPQNLRQDPPRTPQDPPKTPPRWPQEGPKKFLRGLQEAPKMRKSTAKRKTKKDAFYWHCAATIK